MLRKLALTTALAAALVGASAGAASALSAEPCPSGYTGVIIEHEGKQTSVCQNIIR